MEIASESKNLDQTIFDINYKESYQEFSITKAIPTPGEWEGTISDDLWGIIHSVSTWTIRHHNKLLPRSYFTWPPCVNQSNTYSIYASVNYQKGDERTISKEYEIFRVDEVSDPRNRFFCKPHHPFRLEFRQYIPIPGDDSTSNYNHLSQDMLRDLKVWETDSMYMQEGLNKLYNLQPVLFTLIRDQGQTSDSLMQTKCLNFFAVKPSCMDKVTFYAGNTHQIANHPEQRYIGYVSQPLYAGGFYPTVHLRSDKQYESSDPFGKVEGPCIYGGCIEFCFDYNFLISHFKSPRMKGDIGTITKSKPPKASRTKETINEIYSEDRMYQITFDEKVCDDLTPSQKLIILSSQLFADYAYFNGNTEPCVNTIDSITCYCLYCSIYGWSSSCYCSLPKQQ